MAENSKLKEKKKTDNRSLWGRFMNYCHGVKTEFKRVHWTSKSDLGKYSIATLTFVIVFSLFFYGINALML